MVMEQAIQALADCEKRLRELGSAAISAGEYDSARQLLDWATALRAQAAGSVNGGRPAGANGPAAAPAPETRPAPDRPAAKAGRPRYPQFFRRGDELLRLGWSKKQRKEYIHRAPRIAVDLLLPAVRQAGARGRLFTGDQLGPLRNPADGSTIPGYQMYVALAWLEHLGVLKHKGRKAGYGVARETTVEQVTGEWDRLQEWGG